MESLVLNKQLYSTVFTTHSVSQWCFSFLFSIPKLFSLWIEMDLFSYRILNTFQQVEQCSIQVYSALKLLDMWFYRWFELFVVCIDELDWDVDGKDKFEAKRFIWFTSVEEKATRNDCSSIYLFIICHGSCLFRIESELL